MSCRKRQKMPRITRFHSKQSLRKRDPASSPQGEPVHRIVAGILKWLVPSISMLFIAVGYVVVSSHDNLFGIDTSHSTSDFILNASAFFYDLFTTLPNSIIQVVVSHHLRIDNAEVVLLLLALVLAITISILGRRRFLRKHDRYKQYPIAILVICVVAAKFVIMDAPVAAIDSVLIDKNPWRGKSDERAIPLEMRLEYPPHDALICTYDRARDLWINMVYSRGGSGLYFRKKAIPQYNQATSKQRIRDEFLAQSIASILILILSCQLLWKADRSAIAVIAVLCAAYVLTWPYAYGKLLQSTYFRLGEVTFKVGPVTAPGQAPPDLGINAIVFDTGHTSSKFLVTKETTCSEQLGETGEGAATAPVTMEEVKLWEVPNSEIVSIKEIYWEDVISWKVKHQGTYPTAACPGAKGRLY